MPDAQTLIQQHGDAVWRTAYRLLGNPEDARDCYQDTFLDAIRLAARGTAVTHWSAVLRKIATCRAMDRLRRRYRRREESADFETFTSNGRLADDPSHRLETLELCDQVRGLLAALPPRQAEAFWLRHLEQLSPDEIAAQMSVSPANARQLVHRATEAIRRRLDACSAQPGPTAPPARTLTGEQR